MIQEITFALPNIPMVPETIYLRPMTPKNCEAYKKMCFETGETEETFEELDKNIWASILYRGEWHYFGDFNKDARKLMEDRGCIFIEADYDNYDFLN